MNPPTNDLWCNFIFDSSSFLLTFLCRFYQWDRADGQKIKYLFRRPGEAALYMAGIWNTYRDGEGQEKQRFVILTTTANRSMKADIQELTLFPDGENRLIHDRMPVILSRSEQEEWLSGPVDFEQLFQREHILLEKVNA